MSSELQPPTDIQPAALPTEYGPARLPGKAKGSSDMKVKILIVLGVVAVMFIVLAFVTLSILQRTQLKVEDDPRLTPSPTPLATPTLGAQILGKPSKYANDPQILELQAAILTMEAQIDTDDLLYPELDPPVLIKGISFNLK